MKSTITLLCLVFTFIVSAQNEALPRYMTPAETAAMRSYTLPTPEGIPTPPPGPIRTMAEWEEIEYLTITWTGWTDILAQIVDAAQEEVTVIITCNDSNSVINNLASDGVPNLNLRFIEQGFNSIWCRDYGQNSVYLNDVDSLVLVDWIYNRPRPLDDQVPEGIANEFNYAIYSSTVAPNDLVHTGGNFMSEGTGLGFSSNLVVDENGPLGQFNQTVKTPAEVDSLMKGYMAIDPYVRMDELPFDIISHIDMHMKLINENTLLVGEFPLGVSDGPQLEANLQYVLSNFTARDGNPLRLIRIPMPPSTGGNYAPNAHYRTYTNSIFINNTVLVPTYREEFDTTALRIYEESLPGYNIVPINCESIIPAAGALHCITHSIGVRKPLLIQHWNRDTIVYNTSISIEAEIRHSSGIASATMYLRYAGSGTFNAFPMTNTSGDTWSAYVPIVVTPLEPYDKIEYYFEATSNSGKTQLRPMPAPTGYFSTILQHPIALEELEPELKNVYPNPASAITCVPVVTPAGGYGKVELLNAQGQIVATLHEGDYQIGTNRFFFDARGLSAGWFVVRAVVDGAEFNQKIAVSF
ncbi:MAG: agmatine deiminase family protein [Flavobacteriales bacterium]|nr:agmatine deiminase family protein [Flavobacteriales bacterium]